MYIFKLRYDRFRAVFLTNNLFFENNIQKKRPKGPNCKKFQKIFSPKYRRVDVSHYLNDCGKPKKHFSIWHILVKRMASLLHLKSKTIVTFLTNNTQSRLRNGLESNFLKVLWKYSCIANRFFFKRFFIGF